MSESTKFDLSTSEGGRGYLESLFQTQLKRQDFTNYIRVELAADFACALSQYIAPVQAEINAGLAREGALREELAEANKSFCALGELYSGTQKGFEKSQQRLTAAEQRNAELINLLEHAYGAIDENDGWKQLCQRILAVIQPDSIGLIKSTDSGASMPTTEGPTHG